MEKARLDLLEKIMKDLGNDDSASGQPTRVIDASEDNTNYETWLGVGSTEGGLNKSKLNLTALATYGVGGMPASFLPTTDPPIWSTNGDMECSLGSSYLENYIRYGLSLIHI